MRVLIGITQNWKFDKMKEPPERKTNNLKYLIIPTYMRILQIWELLTYTCTLCIGKYKHKINSAPHVKLWLLDKN